MTKPSASTRTTTPFRQRFLSIIFLLYSLICCSIPEFTFAISKSSSSSFYQRLGLSKGCSDAEIKKAYRKAALKHHPDKGGNEETFKEVTEAYDVLSDPEKRKLYDQFGTAGLSGAQPPNFGTQNGQGGSYGTSGFSFGTADGPGAFNFFGNGAQPNQFGSGGGINLDIQELLRNWAGGESSMFGMRNQQPSPAFKRRRKPPKVYERPVRCSLEELCTGATKKLKVNFGASLGSKVYTIQIKPGWKAGTKIKYPASSRFPAMVFVVQEKKHLVFKRVGDDLVYQYHLDKSKNSQPSPHSNTDKASQQHGSSVTLDLKLPTGETWSRTIPANSILLRAGRTCTVPDKGMPIKGGPARGNLIIEFS